MTREARMRTVNAALIALGIPLVLVGQTADAGMASPRRWYSFPRRPFNGASCRNERVGTSYNTGGLGWFLGVSAGGWTRRT